MKQRIRLTRLSSINMLITPALLILSTVGNFKTMQGMDQKKIITELKKQKSKKSISKTIEKIYFNTHNGKTLMKKKVCLLINSLKNLSQIGQVNT